MRHTITIASDLVVDRYDAEYADMSNPQGAVVEEVYYLLATDRLGYRKAYGSFNTEQEAEAAIPAAPPVSTWNDSSPEYGSVAYQQSDAEQDLCQWERDHDGPVYGLRATYQPQPR